MTSKVFLRPNMVTWNSLAGAYAEETRFFFEMGVFFFVGGGGVWFCSNDIRYITLAKTKEP